MVCFIKPRYLHTFLFISNPFISNQGLKSFGQTTGPANNLKAKQLCLDWLSFAIFLHNTYHAWPLETNWSFKKKSFVSLLLLDISQDDDNYLEIQCPYKQLISNLSPQIMWFRLATWALISDPSCLFIERVYDRHILPFSSMLPFCLVQIEPF